MMKKVLLYSLLALLTILNSVNGQAFQEGRASAARTAQDAPQAEQPCVGKSGEKLNNADVEADFFIENIDSFTNEIVRIIGAAPNPASGVDEAQKLLDAQKQTLHGQFFLISSSKKCQFSKQMQKKMSDSFYQDGVKVGQLQARYGSDPAVKAKLQKLTQDFLDIFKREGNSQEEGDGKAGGMNAPVDSPKSDPCLSKTGEQLEKKDAEINSFVDNINAFTDELVNKVESASNRSAGADEALKHMDNERARIRVLFESVKDIKECQVSAETKKRMSDSFYQDGVNIGQLQAKHGSDPAVRAKLQKLTQEYLDLFKMESSGP